MEVSSRRYRKGTEGKEKQVVVLKIVEGSSTLPLEGASPPSSASVIHVKDPHSESPTPRVTFPLPLTFHVLLPTSRPGSLST
jgi:hypothetical protein